MAVSRPCRCLPAQQVALPVPCSLASIRGRPLELAGLTVIQLFFHQVSTLPPPGIRRPRRPASCSRNRKPCRPSSSRPSRNRRQPSVAVAGGRHGASCRRAVARDLLIVSLLPPSGRAPSRRSDPDSLPLRRHSESRPPSARHHPLSRLSPPPLSALHPPISACFHSLPTPFFPPPRRFLPLRPTLRTLIICVPARDLKFILPARSLAVPLAPHHHPDFPMSCIFRPRSIDIHAALHKRSSSLSKSSRQSATSHVRRPSAIKALVRVGQLV